MKISKIIGGLVLASMLMACPDPNNVGTPVEQVNLRPLPAVFTATKAIAYSGYRVGESPKTGVYPSEANIEDDMEMLAAKGFGLIRLYESGTHGSRVLKVLKSRSDLNIKVQLGIWIGGPKATADAANQAEISRGITLALTYPDIVVAVSVGNETMVDWNKEYRTPPEDLAAYIKQVRDQVTQPVTTNDNWEPFAFINEGETSNAVYDGNEAVLSAVDYLAVHVYPHADSKWGLWDEKQLAIPEGPDRAVALMDAALVRAKDGIKAVRAALQERGYNLPIVIGETGWQSVDKENGYVAPHEVNQKMYYDRITDWTYNAAKKDADSPLACFYFSAFDEPWKGKDDAWGLWKVDRSEKFVLSGTGYTMDQAKYFIPEPSVGTITAPEWSIMADTVATGALVFASSKYEWNQWGNGGACTRTWQDAADGNPDGGGFMRIGPSSNSWGWGAFIMHTSPSLLAPFDLSNFTNGHLKFNIRTTYPGKLEFGFMTGVNKNTNDVYIQVASGEYGYKNDGQWCEVSIPISTLMEYSAKKPAEMTSVCGAFVLADRIAQTGNGSQRATIDIDGIRWTQD